VPIVVGGAGFYLRALLYGAPSGPPSVPQIRRELEAAVEQYGADVMYERLRSKDPEYAKTITANDKQKIVRALEIITLTGDKVTKLNWQRKNPIPEYQFHPWFIYRPRESLYQRIEERCDIMIEQGLVEEVEGLLDKGLLDNPSASQAIGYRQTIDYLNTERTDEDFQRYVQRFKQASRRYAKRQFTWFRRETMFRWMDVDLHDFELAADLMMQEFHSW